MSDLEKQTIDQTTKLNAPLDRDVILFSPEPAGGSYSDAHTSIGDVIDSVLAVIPASTDRNKVYTVTDGKIYPELYESHYYNLTNNSAFNIEPPDVSGDFSFTCAVHITRSNLSATYTLNMTGATIRNIGQYPIGSASSASFETLFLIVYRIGGAVSVDVSIGRVS